MIRDGAVSSAATLTGLANQPQDAHQETIILKGYGWTTACIASFLICEKGIPSKNIWIFEEQNAIGGCWLEANTHSETFWPITGSKQLYYPPYDLVQRVVRGRPLNRRTMIDNLTAIWSALQFNLVLDSRIVAVDETEKTVTVESKNGIQHYRYDVLISPHYRTMNSYRRAFSLSDGLRNISLSGYKCFKLVGNGLNTAETIKYIIDNMDPGLDYRIEVYYRNSHPVLPRVLFAFNQSGLPVLYMMSVLWPVFRRFRALIRDPEFKTYLECAIREQRRRPAADFKFMGGDFLFHPSVARRLRIIRYDGNLDNIPITCADLLIDTRNDQGINRAVTRHGAHFEIDMGLASHPIAGAYVFPHVYLIQRGIQEVLWSAIAETKPNDGYFWKASNAIDSHKFGSNFWHYAHDVQARIVPFAYWLFPIAGTASFLLWLLFYKLAAITGLIAFFIDLDAVERAPYLVDDSPADYLKMKNDWETLNHRFGVGVPYPLSQREYLKAEKGFRHSLVKIKGRVGFYRRIRRAYVVGMVGVMIVAVWLGLHCLHGQTGTLS